MVHIRDTISINSTEEGVSDLKPTNLILYLCSIEIFKRSGNDYLGTPCKRPHI